jgi:two-component system phosphate regulon sensor histidine kinase PhoR
LDFGMMAFGNWFYRLFAVLAGVTIVQAAITTGLVVANWPTSAGGASVTGQLWLVAVLLIAVGGAAIGLCVRQMTQPLTELSQFVRSLPGGETDSPAAVGGRDELSLLVAAVGRMQRDLAQRRDQMAGNADRLQTVLSSMTEGVLAVGPDKSILLANEAARQQLEFATPDAEGRSLVAVTRARAVNEAVGQALAGPAPVVREFDAPGPTRRRLALRATRLPGDPCPGVVIVLHDMTEIRRLESLRRELVANVSHELKTPLAAIKGYAETLRLGAINDQEHNLHFVRRIEEQADRLHQLILDILQIARVESGQETFDFGDIAVESMFDQCHSQFAESAAARQIELKIEQPPQPLWIYADEEGVRTILSNLVDNGLKYTPAGGRVLLRASEAGNLVVLEVSDTGVGIGEQHLDRIFERFYRVDKARSSELGGTGLGLSIVKHLAQAFGGTASVESQPGHGSTFRVSLPRTTNKTMPPGERGM